MKTLIGAVLILCGLLCAEAYAVDFVYRVDTRPPDQIFRDGFSSHGNNRNLEQHMRGDSCAGGSRDSAYIATTSGVDRAASIARTYYSMVGFPGPLYRYRIRADDNFYNARVSLDSIQQSEEDLDVRFIMMADLQDEYVALNRIPTENIMEAVLLNYNRDTLSITDGDGYSNGAYVRRETHSNPGIIPDLPRPPVSFRQQIAAFGALCSACFSMRGVRRDEASSRAVDLMPFFDARPVLDQILSLR